MKANGGPWYLKASLDPAFFHSMCFCFVQITPPVWSLLSYNGFIFFRSLKNNVELMLGFFSTFFLFLWFSASMLYSSCLNGMSSVYNGVDKNGETWILKTIKIAHHVSLFSSLALQGWLSFFFFWSVQNQDLKKNNLSPDFEIQCLYHSVSSVVDEKCADQSIK